MYAQHRSCRRCVSQSHSSGECGAVAQPELEHVHGWHPPLFANHLLDCKPGNVKAVPV